MCFQNKTNQDNACKKKGHEDFPASPGPAKQQNALTMRWDI
jgi:hypothetical protein